MRKASLKGIIGVAVLVASGMAVALLSLLAAPGAPPAAQPPAFKSAMFYGGAGDQRGTAAAVRNGQIYVGGSGVIGGYWSGAYLVRYGVPPEAPLGATVLPTHTYYYALTAASGTVYAVGCARPSNCGATDYRGDTEDKSMLARLDAQNGSLVGCQSPKIFPSYDGGESFFAVTSVVESGVPVVYAAGGAETCGWGYASFVLYKFDAGGSFINKTSVPGVPWGACVGHNNAVGIATLNEHVYIVGRRGAPSYDDYHPFIMKYDPSLALHWDITSPDTTGEFTAITSLGSYLYAVGAAGTQEVPTGRDFLIEKYDESSNRVWRQTSGTAGEDMLTGIVAVGDRLFAVGYTKGPDNGDADMMILEIDPDTGATLSTTYYGGALDDFARGAATNGVDLFVVGESRSFASDEGNAVGQNDIVLLHYSLNRPPVADDQSVNADGGVSLNIDLSATDEDNNDLTYAVVLGPSHGDLSGTAPNLVYTAPSTYWGPDEFTFKANDGTDDSNVATVTIAVNHVPVATGQSISTDENMSAAILMGASTDVDGDSLFYKVLSGPSHGVLTGSAPNLTYVPTTYYYGPDSFTFKVNDGRAFSNVAAVLIMVDRVFAFSGFTQPVDNIPTVNSAKAGSTIPVKWRITDLNGTPISDPTSFNNIASYNIGCTALTGDPVDEVETYAGTSGLQYFGDGNWQFNWKTTKSYLNQCRTMVLTLADGSTHTAYFKFK